MDAGGYVLPSASRLQRISVTEIVLGALALIGSIYDLISLQSYYAFYVACAVFLLSTGIHGVRAIRRYRMRILDGRSFRNLAGGNVLLCIFCSICLLALLWGMISRLQTLNISDDDKGTVHGTRRTYDGMSWRNSMFVVGLVAAAVLATLLIGLTATAATISFRISASILAAGRQPMMVAPPGARLMAEPGFGTDTTTYMEPPPAYTPYPLPPTYTPYPMVKQNLD